MTILLKPFKREDHIYSNPAFAEFLKDAVRVFNGSPVTALPPHSFAGSGVYALYCTATKGPYAKFGKEINRLEYKIPIYVGKAVPPGWRQSRQLENVEDTSSSLASRLRQHCRSIEQGQGLFLKDFHVRKLLLSPTNFSLANDLVRILISIYKPLWNTKIRGFYQPRSSKGQISAWELLHMADGQDSPEKQKVRKQIGIYLTKLAQSLAA